MSAELALMALSESCAVAGNASPSSGNIALWPLAVSNYFSLLRRNDVFVTLFRQQDFVIFARSSNPRTSFSCLVSLFPGLKTNSHPDVTFG